MTPRKTINHITRWLVAIGQSVRIEKIRVTVEFCFEGVARRKIQL